MYPLIEVFGRSIGTYGLCAFVGFAVSVLVAYLVSREKKVTVDDLLLLALSVGVGIFLGGHLLYALTRPDLWRAFFTGAPSFWGFLSRLGEIFGGMVFYGGFLGGFCAVLLFTRFSGAIPRAYVLDLYALTTPLFHAFGRLGCFFGGCCYGKEWSWGVYIEENPINPSVAGVVRFPVQLFEAGYNLLIFGFLLFLFCKKRAGGKLLTVYLLLYPAARFILEFFRGDEIRGFFLGLSTSQWISLALFAWSILSAYRRFRQEQDRKNAPDKEKGDAKTA